MSGDFFHVFSTNGTTTNPEKSLLAICISPVHAARQVNDSKKVQKPTVLQDSTVGQTYPEKDARSNPRNSLKCRV